MPIIVTLKGGIGNQLFQYAAALQVSRFRKAELLIDISELKGRQRRFEIGNFNISGRVLTPGEFFFFRGLRAVCKSQQISSFLRIMGQKPITFIIESSYGFSNLLDEAPESCWIYGYWQSYRYFEGICAEILAELTSISLLGNAALRFSEKISRYQCVGLHVRRGDYVNDPAANAIHGVCPLEYYMSALRLICEKRGVFYVFLFSDDPEWLVEVLAPQINQAGFVPVVISGQGPLTDVEELFLFSLCDNQIISNSTYSWWGAWLNKNPNKLVIRPSRWFNRFDADVSSVCPPSWIPL